MQIAETGVDVISVGDLTYSIRAVDISLDVQDIKPSACTIERPRAAAKQQIEDATFSESRWSRPRRY